MRLEKEPNDALFCQLTGVIGLSVEFSITDFGKPVSAMVRTSGRASRSLSDEEAETAIRAWAARKTGVPSVLVMIEGDRRERFMLHDKDVEWEA